jgi:putative Mn2+ efflux pump MntP
MRLSLSTLAPATSDLSDMNLFAFTLLALFAVAQNVDNFVLASAYRFKNVRIPEYPNLSIAVLSGLATVLAAAAGWAFGEKAVQRGHWEVTEIMGRGLLIMLGVWTLVGYFRKKLFRQLREREDMIAPAGVRQSQPELPKVIGSSEANVAATALAIDNLAPSFAFGVRHPGFALWSVFLLGVLTAAVSVMCVVLGQSIGRDGRSRFHRSTLQFVSPELVSGLLVIAIALFDPGDFAHGLVEK